MTGRYEKSKHLKPKNFDLGVSKRALAVARTIDRICRSPGHYQINLTIPSHKRDCWTVEFNRTEKIRKVDLGS